MQRIKFAAVCAAILLDLCSTPVLAQVGGTATNVDESTPGMKRLLSFERRGYKVYEVEDNQIHVRVEKCKPVAVVDREAFLASMTAEEKRARAKAVAAIQSFEDGASSGSRPIFVTAKCGARTPK